MKRKGMGAGEGKGYKNIIKGYDKKVHSDSARGRKQPQRIPKLPQIRKRKKEYTIYVDVNDGELYSTMAENLEDAIKQFKQDHPEDVDKMGMVTSDDGIEQF